MANEEEKITLEGQIYTATPNFDGSDRGYGLVHEDPINFEDGNFKFPKNLKGLLDTLTLSFSEIHKENGKDKKQIYSLPFMKEADLDKNGIITEQEATAQYLAVSMVNPENTVKTREFDATLKKTEIKVLALKERYTFFDNDVSPEDIAAAKKYPERLRALAEQILDANFSGEDSKQTADKKAANLEIINSTGTGKELAGKKQNTGRN